MHNTKFYKITLKNKQANRFPQQVIRQLCEPNYQDIVKLNNGKWRQLYLDKNVGQIQTWQVVHLNLQQNQEKDILMQIKEIKFSYLKCLQLKLNRIQNLQPLTELYAPNLQIICLQANQFSKLRNLRKCSFPNIRQLKIAGNKINDFQTLSQAQWPRLERIYLEWFYGVSTGDNIKFVAKMQSNSLLEIWIQNPRTIIKLQVLKSLYRRSSRLRYQSFRTNINSIIRKQVTNS